MGKVRANSSVHVRETSRGVTFKVEMPCKVEKEGRYYVAIAPDFDIASQGGSKASAMRKLVEAVHLFFETCYETGTLHEVLVQSGFEAAHGRRIGGPEIDEEMIEVPLSLVAAQALSGASTQPC